MKDLLKSLAPLLGTAIAGPFGALAASFLADKLGVQEKTVAAVTEALSTHSLTAEQVTAIRQAEIEFKKWMGDNEIKREQLVIEDRKDARAMMVATRAKTPAVLTWVIVTAVLGLEGAILLNGMPSGVNDFVLGRILGTLETSLGLTLAFWFGTTNSSADKTAMLANSTPGK